MLFWLLSGLGVVALFAFFVIRNAEAHDKEKKFVNGRPRGSK